MKTIKKILILNLIAFNCAVLSNNIDYKAISQFYDAYEALKVYDLPKAKEELPKIKSLSEKQKNKLINQVSLLIKNKYYLLSDNLMREALSVALGAFLVVLMIIYSIERNKDALKLGKGGFLFVFIFGIIAFPAKFLNIQFKYDESLFELEQIKKIIEEIQVEGQG